MEARCQGDGYYTCAFNQSVFPLSNPKLNIALGALINLSSMALMGYLTLQSGCLNLDVVDKNILLYFE